MKKAENEQLMAVQISEHTRTISGPEQGQVNLTAGKNSWPGHLQRHKPKCYSIYYNNI